MPRRELKRCSDEQLTSFMREGDEAALEVLYERHVDHVFALAYRMLGTRGPAEEVVKVAFGSAWSDRAAYGPGPGGVRAWLLRITHEKAVDVLRGHAWAGRPSPKRAQVNEGGPVGDERAGTLPADPQDAPALLPAALAGLSPGQARIIELAYFGGYSQSEISEMLEVPAVTVKRRMRAALEHLDRALSEGDA